MKKSSPKIPKPIPTLENAEGAVGAVAVTALVNGMPHHRQVNVHRIERGAGVFIVYEGHTLHLSRQQARALSGMLYSTVLR